MTEERERVVYAMLHFCPVAPLHHILPTKTMSQVVIIDVLITAPQQPCRIPERMMCIVGLTFEEILYVFQVWEINERHTAFSSSKDFS